MIAEEKTQQPVNSKNRKRKRRLYTGPCIASSRKSAKITDMEGIPIESYVFGYVDGSPRRTTWWKDHLENALDQAKIDRGGDENTMPLDAHSFRHTLASNLKSRGMPDGLIRMFFRWSGAKVQSNYTHFDPDLIRHYTQWLSKQA